MPENKKFSTTKKVLLIFAGMALFSLIHYLATGIPPAHGPARQKAVERYVEERLAAGSTKAYVEKRLGIVEEKPAQQKPITQTEYINFSEPIIFEGEDGTNAFKQDSFWVSYIDKKHIPEIRSASHDAQEAGGLLFLIALVPNNCDTPIIRLWTFTKNSLVELADKRGTINIDGQFFSLQYSSKGRDIAKTAPDAPFGSIIFLSPIDANLLIEAMHKGNIMYIDLPDQKIGGTISLQGFTASFNRMNGLCRVMIDTSKIDFSHLPDLPKKQ